MKLGAVHNIEGAAGGPGGCIWPFLAEGSLGTSLMGPLLLKGAPRGRGYQVVSPNHPNTKVLLLN